MQASSSSELAPARTCTSKVILEEQEAFRVSWMEELQEVISYHSIIIAHMHAGNED